MIVLCFCLTAVVFALYDLPAEPVAYVLSLSLAVLLLFAAVQYLSLRKKYRTLEKLRTEMVFTGEHLPNPNGVLEQEYQTLLRVLSAENRRLQGKADEALTDLVDYYTMWVHQIKTPIAAMRLILQREPGERSAELEIELLKIGQYVDMVLQYLRLDSDSTDFVLAQCGLDALIRRAVRKYAKLFIRKKIRLEFTETGAVVLTDEKWLTFVLEQLLSNALKYTDQGTISIFLEPEQTLVIADTGIGIAPEDLPRVFEKGFTGYNGRTHQKSTGIGLHLCRRIVTMLSHTISIDSTVGKGTQVRLDLSHRKTPIE